MPIETPRMTLAEDYAESAQRYLESLPLEHFTEATPQAMQREITLESLAIMRKRRADFHVFNELLVQYQIPGADHRGQVVPDNMVVIWPEKIHAIGSYDVPLQPVGPFWVLEYVSKNSRRKDYVDNMQKYEHELRVPYYLLFEPEVGELAFYRHNQEEFIAMTPNAAGRYAISELDLEVGIHDEWVRFWHQGEMLPLPAEWDESLTHTKRELAAERQRAESESQRADQEKQAREALEREIAQLRAQLNGNN